MTSLERRALLATVATGGLSIAGATTAAGQSGRTTAAGNGFVIQWEDCGTVHVRGRQSEGPVRVVGYANFVYNGRRTSGYALRQEAELPITLTVADIRARHSGTVAEPILYHGVHIARPHPDRTVLFDAHLPDDRLAECRQHVFGDAGEQR